LFETDRFAARAAEHQARCLAHVVQRGQAPRQRRVTLEDAVPELRELRELLEENLAGLRSIYEEQRRAVGLAMQETGAPVEELRALLHSSAPWVHALDQTRQLIRSAFLEVAAAHVRHARELR
jgi:predicted  nucleic acid-binding Zn-ribbon protein